MGGSDITRKARLIRLPPEVDAALVQTAKSYGLSVNAYVEQLISGEGWAHPVIAVEQPVLPVGVVLAADKHARLDCLHPKRSRKIHSWGARCGDCGVRL